LRARRASIRSETARHCYVIIDYSNDESDFSDEDTDDNNA
jgi:hypothetical protein